MQYIPNVFQDLDEDTALLLRAFSTSEDNIIEAFSLSSTRLQVFKGKGRNLSILTQWMPNPTHPWICIPQAFTITLPTSHFQVIRRSEGSIWALGPRRQLGVGVLDLGCLGVLIVTFDR